MTNGDDQDCMFPRRALVMLATYNEIGNLPSLVDEIRRQLPEADVLVIDDNSPDGTGRWCDERAAVDSHVRCLHRPAKQGLGTATLAGFRTAIDANYDIVVTLDADWSHDPRFLSELVRTLERADVAIGSRYCPGAAIDGWPWSRRLMSRAVNAITRVFLRLPVRDASNAYRAYRVARLGEIDLDQVHAAGFAYLEELLWHLDRAHATFAEVPIIFQQRRAGRSKAGLREAAGKIATIGKLGVRGRLRRLRISAPAK
jgi:dolichol-phosphate mannosyltransferase